MTKRKSDLGLDEVRRVRHEISAEIRHDPKRLLEYFRPLEAEYADRLVQTEKGAVEEPRPVSR